MSNQKCLNKCINKLGTLGRSGNRDRLGNNKAVPKTALGLSGVHSAKSQDLVQTWLREYEQKVCVQDGQCCAKLIDMGNLCSGDISWYPSS